MSLIKRIKALFKHKHKLEKMINGNKKRGTYDEVTRCACGYVQRIVSYHKNIAFRIIGVKIS